MSTLRKFILMISFFVASIYLHAATISIPKNNNPTVDNIKEIQKAQKDFMKLCLKPSPSQLNTLEIIKNNTSCSIPALPSVKGCQQIRNCYISKYQLYGMYKIELYDSNISDLSPLQFFMSPRNFILNGNNISDISYLSKLDNVEDLILSANPIKDISGLKNLKLYKLGIYATPINDISALKNMTSLRILTIGDNVKNIEPLKALVKLRVLNLKAKHKIDICQIKNLYNLELLAVSGGDITDISCLSKLVNLKSLTLEDMPLSDISVIKNYKKLEDLTLKNVKIDNIESIRNLKRFSVLGLVNTKVRDLSVLTQMKNNGHSVYFNHIYFKDNPLIHCSPKNDDDVSHGKSCYEKNGKRKSLLKMWLDF